MADIGSRQGRKRMSLVLLLVAALWTTPTCLAQQVTQVTTYPAGVYGMWPITIYHPDTTPPTLVTQHISSSQTRCIPTLATTTDPYSGALLLANTGVVGILLEVPWTSVDTGMTAPSYNWKPMNDVLTEAWLCGLRVALSLSMPLDNTTTAGPQGLPPWVMNQIGCVSNCPNGMAITNTVMNLSTDSDSMKICMAPGSPTNCLCPAMDSNKNCLAPVFWDMTFNMDRMNFIQAVAADIFGTPNIPAMLPADAQQNIVAVLVQPFGATTDDWNIPHALTPEAIPVDCLAWNTAGYSTTIMFGVAQMILNQAAESFPTLNLKLPIQAEGIALDQLPSTTPCMNLTPGTGVDLATQVLQWAYRTSTNLPPPPPTFPLGSFFAQLNFVTTVPPQPNNPVFNLIQQYQPQVGLQDVAAAVDGPEDNCQQNGDMMMPCAPPAAPGTPPAIAAVCDSVQYATVSQNTFNNVVQPHTPRFWEISRGDDTTAIGLMNPCPITSDDQCSMRDVFSAATTQLAQLPLPPRFRLAR
jgi:hypothetical protein